MNRRSYQRHLLNRFEILERKLEPECEQEEGYADFSQQLDFVNVRDRKPAGMRPQNNPCRDIAEDQGLAKPLQQQAEKKRRHDKENDVSCNSQLYVLFARQIYLSRTIRGNPSFDLLARSLKIQ